MMKDPAFLFYSQDYYTGTRMMLPDERACYIDLLVYQHQNGIIPLELDRVLMFCTGIGRDTLEAVLASKFVKSDKGYTNVRLNLETAKRSLSGRRKSILAVLGNYIKNQKLTPKQKKFIKNDFNFYDYLEIENKEERNKLILKKLNALAKRYAKRSLSLIENENENENEIYNNINTPEKIILDDQIWLEQFAMRKYMRLEEIKYMLNQYSLKLIADNKDSDLNLKALRAGFEKWVNTWQYNDAKKEKSLTQKVNNNLSEEELQSAY